MKHAVTLFVATFTSLGLCQVQVAQPVKVHHLKPGEKIRGPGEPLQPTSTPEEQEATRRIWKDFATCVKAARKLADEDHIEQAIKEYERAAYIAIPLGRTTSDEVRTESLVIQKRYRDASTFYLSQLTRKSGTYHLDAQAALPFIAMQDFSTALRILKPEVESPCPIGPEIGNHLPSSQIVTDRTISATAYLLAARAVECRGQPNLALRYLAKANSFAPNDASISFLAGKLNYQEARYKEALPYLEIAVKKIGPEVSDSITRMLDISRYYAKHPTKSGNK